MADSGRKAVVAARMGRLKELDELIRVQHADIDFIELPHNRSPLFHAAWKGYEAICKYLLDKGAKVGVVDYEGRSPLHEACFYGHMAVITLLIDRGSDINLPDNNGHTPLFRAVQGRRQNVVDFLLEKGAKLNLHDPHELTVSHFAAFTGQPELSHVLFFKGAYYNKFNLNDRKEGVAIRQQLLNKDGQAPGSKSNAKDAAEEKVATPPNELAASGAAEEQEETERDETGTEGDEEHPPAEDGGEEHEGAGEGHTGGEEKEEKREEDREHDKETHVPDDPSPREVGTEGEKTAVSADSAETSDKPVDRDGDGKPDGAAPESPAAQTAVPEASPAEEKPSEVPAAA